MHRVASTLEKHHGLQLEEFVMQTYLSFSLPLLLNLCGRRPDIFLNRKEAILTDFPPSWPANTSLGMCMSAISSSIGDTDSLYSSISRSLT